MFRSLYARWGEFAVETLIRVLGFSTVAFVLLIFLFLLSLRYSRDNEYEADDMGRSLSYAAGYDPAGNVEFFARLMDKYEKTRPSRIEMLFRTHPDTADRIARAVGIQPA